MLNRRRLFLALPLVATARLGRAAPDWRREVSEVRFAAAGLDAGASAPGMGRRLGLVVRHVPLQGAALVDALDRGHLELALLDGQALAAARARMGGRLVAGPVRADGLALVMRRVLPAAMRHDLAAALA